MERADFEEAHKRIEKAAQNLVQVVKRKDGRIRHEGF